jgi:segregation and condensation protein A
MRDAGARLLARDRLGRDVFARTAPEGLRTLKVRQWDASLFDLLQAYGQVQARTAPVVHMVARRDVMTLETALHRLEAMLGVTLDWTDLASLLPPGDDDFRRSALASSFVAALELARTGRADLRQEATFAPLYLRKTA